ncbi:MAG TPA: DUF1045 domain-containing protein [Alphaproteobacteria bacterium]
MPRYALYYAPRPDEALARFAASWLGRDPERDGAVVQPLVGGLASARLAEITAEPRRYGFHGTLKPPFDLAPSATLERLLADAAAFASQRRPIELPRLTLKAIGGFLALVPDHHPALDALAADCVSDFDAFRAPPDPADVARRRQAGLSARQDELLARWGYPYVMDEFRFHLTLTGSLEAPERAVVERVLEPLVAPFSAAPLPVRDLVLFVQDSRDRPFRILARFPFQV